MKLDSFKAGNYEQALKDLYLKIDKILQTDKEAKAKLKKYKKDGAGGGSFYAGQANVDDIAMGTGCTAVSAIITRDKIYLGNAGDSRAIVGLVEAGHVKGV